MNIIEIEAGSVIHPPQNETILTILTLVCSSIGIALSAAALLLLFLTAILYAEWRRNYKNQLLIQFMIARFLYTFVRYFYDIRNVLNWYINNDAAIYFDMLWMFYTETTLVFWMYTFSKQMYDSLVKVFVVENKKLWKVSVIAWLMPALITIALMLLFYIYHELSYNLFFFYILFVKWPMLIANAVLIILALKSVLKNNKSGAESNGRIVVVMIILIFMFCIQQVLIDSYKIMYILLLHKYSLSSHLLLTGNILSLYHCAFSIIFWVFGNAKTRRMWRCCFTELKDKKRPLSRCLSKY
ncbi:hypothetical protein O3G_MSEX012531 [Manduca sexta]|uniref:Uncharacterized protein n=1 Tax=Manduca sexta TaxID=7130 RepID=A0A922CVQ6_MANSE|nr:hypothetical protein O3G_MSEX012531 [Manduca sexta]